MKNDDQIENIEGESYSYKDKYTIIWHYKRLPINPKSFSWSQKTRQLYVYVFDENKQFVGKSEVENTSFNELTIPIIEKIIHNSTYNQKVLDVLKDD